MNASRSRRRDVVADRAAHRVLEVEDAGVRRGHHQVARHPVAMHRDGRLGQRAGHEPVAQRGPRRTLALVPGDAVLALDAPDGEQVELAPQQRVVVGRQLARVAARLPLDQRGDRVAHQRIGFACRRLAQRVEVEPAAEVGEQQEAALDVGLEHARRVQRSAFEQRGDVDERAHVFLRRRGVHDDERRVVRVDPEVTPKAGVAGGRAQGRRPQSVTCRDAVEPLFERLGASRGHG